MCANVLQSWNPNYLHRKCCSTKSVKSKNVLNVISSHYINKQDIKIGDNLYQNEKKKRIEELC